VLMTTDHSASVDSELVLDAQPILGARYVRCVNSFIFDEIEVTFDVLGPEIHDETASQNGIEQGTDKCAPAAVHVTSTEAIITGCESTVKYCIVSFGFDSPFISLQQKCPLHSSPPDSLSVSPAGP
jgi:hypothetical protein